MSKKLYFLISFVLVLSLGGLAQADAIEVNNPSFEIGSDGNQVCGHQELGVGWEWAGTGYVGLDTFCPYASCTPGHCHNWPGSDDPCGAVYCYIMNNGNSYIYQFLDMNNSDANGVIVEGRMYTLTVDSLTEKIAPSTITSSFFYGDNPDANEVASKTHTLEIKQRPMEDCTDPAPDPGPRVDYCRDWNYDLRLRFVAEASEGYLGKILGIKFAAPSDDNYNFVDNVRLEWCWASSAYDPFPADEAEDVPIDVNLAWSPGLWAADTNGHEVYFGTSESEVADANTNTAGIYRGSGVGVVTGPDANNRYSYDVLETLELGKTYYWRIDEVNKNWGGGPVPPDNNRWEGGVWSFKTTGLAYNVYPADRATDIPALNLSLYWGAGTGAGSHDVYFGSDEADVENATTASGTTLFRGTQPLSDVNYLVEPLETGETYFWRIDEVNTISVTFVKGDVWRFTTGVFLLVDSFEEYRYKDTEDLTDVWKDPFAEPKNDAQVGLFFAKTDVNMIYTGEQSMEFAYRCEKKSGPDFVGSYAGANPADLEIGSTDWTIAGVKALVVNFYGDPCNGWDHHSGHEYPIADGDQMWVELVDGGANAGIVKLPDMTDIQEASWHTWNISLKDPCFSSVDMNNVAMVYIGFGGEKGGQSILGAGEKSGKYDTVWFDDIRLYPPRCMPEMTGLDNLYAVGDFTGDCNTTYLDLDIMARDWCKIGKWGLPVPVIEYLFDEGSGTTVANTGAFGSAYDLTIGLDNTGSPEPKNDPCWFKDDVNDPCRGWTLWFDGELGLHPKAGEDPPQNGGDYLIIPALNLNSNTVTMTAWVKPDGPQQDGFTGLIHHSKAAGDEGCVGLSYASGGGFTYDGTIGYVWNDNSQKTWAFESGIYIPEQRWSFVALVVEPTQATMYIYDTNGTSDPCDDVLEQATKELVHNPEEFDGLTFIAGDSRGQKKRFYSGQMDAVRIYGFSLTQAQLEDVINDIPLTGIMYFPLSSVADLCVGDKSPTDPNAPIDDQIDFCDYSKFAIEWLEKHPWP